MLHTLWFGLGFAQTTICAITFLASLSGRILRFVANDLHGSVTIFWAPLFRVFPTVNPINKACCNTVKLIIFRSIFSRGCWSCRCKSKLATGLFLCKERGYDVDCVLGVDQG
jgi:hypothetical protein